MTFNIFNSPTKEGIDVGYISSDRGYVQNVTICEANEYAKSNPGTVFIVKNRDFVKYLDINEVNALTPQDVIPSNVDECAGYVEDNVYDESGNVVGVTTSGGIDLEYDPRPCTTLVHFSGGGGVGVHANPIIGSDGSVLAVDVIRGGFGYQYPPLVDIEDTCNLGIGVKAKAFIDTKDVTILKYYDEELDVEEYKICDDNTPGFGRRYSQDGKDLGPWDPEVYRKIVEKTPYQKAVDEYNRLLKEYKKPWETGRSVNPSIIIWNTSNRSSKQKYDVTHEEWSDFMNKYAISPVPPSNVPGTDFGTETFTIEWDMTFPTEGEYTFRGLYDGAERFGDFYVDNEKIGTFKKSNEKPEAIRKIYKKGLHKLSFNLKNNIFKKPEDIQPNVSNIVQTPTSFRAPGFGAGSFDKPQKPWVKSHQNDTNWTTFNFTEFLRAYAVFPVHDSSLNGKLQTGIWNIDIKTAGNYTLEVQVDDFGSVKWDGNFVGSVRWTDSRTSTFTINNVSVGTHKLGGEVKNITFSNRWYNNPAGLAWVLRDPFGTIVATSLDSFNDNQLPVINRSTLTTADVSYGDDVPASSIEIRSVFNTKDYIDKANRKLWITDSLSSGFLNVYGITPFDPSISYTSDKAGIHSMVWNRVTFPISANYKIEIQVDDNVRLRIGDQVDIFKDGFDFSIATLRQVATGKSTYTRYIEKGTYAIIADLEQTPGGPLGYTGRVNPMVLAVNIETEVAQREVFDDTKSWNENPLGVALSIESPLPLPPSQALPSLNEGECPPNPIWHTRMSGSSEIWSPVIGFPFWSKFLNQYALSPVPPLDLFGTDGTGVVYRNTWTVDLPYSGQYGLKGAVDNWGRILIDDIPYQRFSNEELSSIPSEGTNNNTLAGPTQKKQPLSRIQLSEGQHTITVEVENWKNYEAPRTFIEKKIFSTKDWQSPNASSAKTFANVTFKFSTNTMYANTLEIEGLDISFEKKFGDATTQVREDFSRDVEYGRVYDVKITSNNIRTGNLPETNKALQFVGLHPANNPINVINGGKRLALKDGDGNDTNASFIIESGNGTFATDGRSIVGTGKQTIILAWNDRRQAGRAIDSIKLNNTTWRRTGRSGTVRHTVTLGGGVGQLGGDNNLAVLRTKGVNVLQMEDIPGLGEEITYDDLVLSASQGRFFDIDGLNAKYTIGEDINTTSIRNGVVYKGPKLYNYKHPAYGSFLRDSGISPDYPKIGGMGEIVSYEWSNVDFDADGEYEFHFANDAHGSLFLDDQEIIKGDFDELVGVSAIDVSNWSAGLRRKVQVTKGKHTISARATDITSGAHTGNVDGLFTKLSSDYYRGQQAFDNNPSAFAVNIIRKVETFPEEGSNDERLGKSWQANPMAISAVLIPAPCPQKIDGKGVVTRVEILDPGNGFPIPPRTTDPPQYEVTLRLVDVVPVKPGIGYPSTPSEVIIDPPDVEPPEPLESPLPPPPPPVGIPTVPAGPGIGTPSRIIVDPPGGGEFEAEFDPFGRLTNVRTIKPGIGFTEFPRINFPSDTGINAQFRPVFEVVRDPIFLDLEPNQLLQVTDLVGLKQTGYYKGRPYYGAVFYQNGVKYAGYFETAGELIRVYDTLQESIDGQVTTPPSAILRQGTDTSVNDPRLNIPDTPENLT